MAQLSCCPNASRWEQLLLGRLHADEAESLYQHLAGCGTCLQAVRQCPSDDTLVEAVRGRPTAVETDLPGPIRLLMDRLKQLPPLRGSRPPADAVQTQEGVDFLAPPQQPGDLGRLGPYRVLAVLGRGGMGVVFRGFDPQLERPVALKALLPSLAANPAARARFLREARSAAALRHDHVVSIYQVGEDAGTPFLAMELLDGEPLDHCLQRQGKLPLAEALRICRQIAEGLGAAHRRGLIHRDVKPANIWLEAGTGRAKLLDFGLARPCGEDAGLTQQGAIVGTPAYMAPEQARGGAVDHRCDLFSLGCVLYRMAVGQAPFDGADAVSALLAVALESPRPSAEVPAPLAGLIVRLMDKDPARRPQSAGAVAEALAAMERDLAAGRLTPPAGKPPRPRRLGLIVLPALLALLPATYYFGGAVVHYVTNKGALLVEVDSDDVELVVQQGGVRVRDRTTRREFVLNAGDGEVAVYEKASGLKVGTRKFTLTRGGRETVTVRVGTPPAVTQRRAAEWVLSAGGRVYLRAAGQAGVVADIAWLPAGDFQVVIAYLDRARVSDSDLANLRGLDHLTQLYLNGRPVGDAGLAHLRSLPRLESLWLDHTQVRDAGMARLQALPRLAGLRLNHTQVGDAGLAHLKALPALGTLALDGTPVSDAGLSHLRGMTRLEDLELRGTRVGDGGLAHLAALPRVRTLQLGDTNVSDAGLVHLKGWEKLAELGLSGTRVSDEGMTHLQGFPCLCALDLGRTRVGDGGLKRLGPGLARLRNLTLAGTPVSDAGLALLAGKAGLYWLDLGGTRVGDAGLKHLAGMTELRGLDLTGTKVTPAGVAALQAALPSCRIRTGPR